MMRFAILAFSALSRTARSSSRVRYLVQPPCGHIDDRCLGVFPPTDEILAAQKRTRETKRQIAEAASQGLCRCREPEGRARRPARSGPSIQAQTQLAAALKNERYERPQQCSRTTAPGQRGLTRGRNEVLVITSGGRALHALPDGAPHGAVARLLYASALALLCSKPRGLRTASSSRSPRSRRASRACSSSQRAMGEIEGAHAARILPYCPAGDAVTFLRGPNRRSADSLVLGAPS